MANWNGDVYRSVIDPSQMNCGGDNINLYLKPISIFSKSGDTIDIPVYLSGTTTLAGSTSLLLPIALDTNVLHLVGLYPSHSGITEGVLSYSNGTEIVPLQGTDLTLNGETLIGTLRCVVYLADTLQTSVSLAGAAIVSSDPRCLSLSANADAVNILIQGCGDATLLKYMKTGSPFSIRSITPNPATSGIHVLLHSVGQSWAYALNDALGRQMQSGIGSATNLDLDMRWLPDGLYFLRMADAVGGIPVTRSVVVQR